MLLESAKLQHAEAHAQQLAAIAEDIAVLHISAAALDKDEDKLRSRFVRRRFSLAAAIQEDAALEGLSEAEILQQVRTKAADAAKQQQILNIGMNNGWGYHQHQHQQHQYQQHQQHRQQHHISSSSGAPTHPAAARQRHVQANGGDYGSGYEGGGEDEYEDEYENEYEDWSDDEEETGPADDGQGPNSTGPQHPPSAAVQRQALVTQGLPAMLQHMSVQRQRGQRSSLQLSDVAAAVQAGMPQQQEQLASIRRRVAVTSTRLRWQVVRPQTYAGDLALTAHQRSIKGLAQSIIEELLDAALAHIAMRPTKQQVAVEMAEWRAARPAALAGISRHVADSIYKEVVEELLAEVAAEAAQAAAAADAFAFDMLVAAVAFSQGKFDLGFKADDGMLWEMRQRRPRGTPYGHTQPLAPHFHAGAAVSKARRIAVSRQRPPLAASAAVWARREAPRGRLEQGGWPTAAHLAAAMREREFWGQVVLRPRMQRASLPGPACLDNTSLLVPDALGAVTALSGCPAGTFLAAGTSRGALLVWDLRKDAAVTPWFQVTGSGQLYKRRWWNPWAAKLPRKPAIAGFAWSADSYQLAALDASSNMKMWWMRPEEREDGQSVAELQARAAPVTPELAVLITPFMVALSGKAPIADESDAAAAAKAAAGDATNSSSSSSSSSATLTQKLGQWLGLLPAEGPGAAREVPPRQWRPVLHPAFTIAGTQPTVVIPQVTGDILSLTTDIGGPVLPGFGPSAFAERANAGAAGLAAATAVAGLGRSGRAGSSAGAAAGDAAGGSMPQAVVDFLMPPQAINADIVSQSLYRGHSSHVVFLGFLPDASLLSLDAGGCLAQWPASASQRCGFGWLTPRKCWQLPHSTRTCQPRGNLQPVWPALPGRAGRVGSSKTNTAAGGTWVPDYCPDAQDRADAKLLQQDPTGAFLLQPRLPWLVRYLPAGSSSSSGSSGRVLRQVLHRPLDNSQPGSNVLLISSYDARSRELLMRAKQRCTFVRAGMKVVSAELTPSRRELLIFCLVAPHQEDPSASHTFAVLVISLASMRQLVPRIDVHDPSAGTAAPAYALTPTLHTTGSEYLLMNLGCGVVGAFSLATGQLVREIDTGLQEVRLQRPGSCYFCALALLRVGEKHGRCGNAGRSLLCCAAAGGAAVYVLELALEEAAQAMQERQQQQQKDQQELAQQQQQQQQQQRRQQRQSSRVRVLQPTGRATH
ncbi:hypothetical protein OEZ86_010628 [Tetradesmus obliquus]|nr:hypothetical protein OEZ86_010628 [Tetradesmus obliquus]